MKQLPYDPVVHDINSPESLMDKETWLTQADVHSGHWSCVRLQKP